MSATAKLSSKLPGDEEINGLDALVPDLLASPTDIICVIGWVKVVKITQDVETGDEIRSWPVWSRSARSGRFPRRS